MHQLGHPSSGYFGYFGVKGEDLKRPSPSRESPPSPRELIGAETPPGRLGGGAHSRPPVQVNLLKGAESDSRVNDLAAQGDYLFQNPNWNSVAQQKVLQSNFEFINMRSRTRLIIKAAVIKGLPQDG